MSSTMICTIDAAGRLVVPKALREEAGLRPGVALSIRCRDGCIEIEPVPREVTIVRRGRVLVARATEPSEQLTEEIVDRTRDAVRSRHATRG